MTKRRNRIRTLDLLLDVILIIASLAVTILSIVAFYLLVCVAGLAALLLPISWTSFSILVFLPLFCLVLLLLSLFALIVFFISIKIFKVRRILDSNFKAVRLRKVKHTKLEMPISIFATSFNLSCYAKIDENNIITFIMRSDEDDFFDKGEIVYEYVTDDFEWFISNFEC